MTDVNTIKNPGMLFQEFSDPAFVIEGSTPMIEDGRELYSKRTVVKTKSFGDIVLVSAYIVGYKKHTAEIVLFLSKKQMKDIKKAGIDIDERRRKHPKPKEAYLCFPSRDQFEKIVSY